MSVIEIVGVKRRWTMDDVVRLAESLYKRFSESFCIINLFFLRKLLKQFCYEVVLRSPG